MDQIYEWLYDHYAQPELDKLPVFSDQQIREAASCPSALERSDRIYSLRLHCCTAAFALGVRTGLALSAPDRS